MSTIQTAFSQLISIAGRSPPDFVTFENRPPALKTRFAADEAAAAAIGANLTLAADIWASRSGETQTAIVNPREVAAGLTGFQHQKFFDESKAPIRLGQADLARTAANGFKRTKDGRFIYLHPSFPESAKRLLRVLGCEDTEAAVNATCLRWNAFELEDAIAGAGACGGVARTPEEWDASAQGRIVAARPVVEVIRIGDSPPEALSSDGHAPLSGVRVLDLTRVLAGPTCARTLAQFGANAMVISAPKLPSVPYFVTDTGHGKLAAYVDLSLEIGRATLRTLVQQADIFSQGYRLGALERLGFGPLELSKLRPGIIYTAINCYGHEGPWRGRPGWEQLGQTVTGMAVIHGGDEGPRLQPAALTDYITGFLAAFGSMVALSRRAAYGGSYLVRVSLAQTATWIRSLGIAGAERLQAVEPLRDGEIASYSITTETGFGRMTHLRPPGQMSVTPPRWTRGVVPLGTHQPSWPAPH